MEATRGESVTVHAGLVGSFLIGHAVGSSGTRVDEHRFGFTKSRGGGEKDCLAIAFGIGSHIGGGSSINVVRPLLDFGGSFHFIGIADILEVSKFPTHEPTKVEGHEELDTDGTEDKDQHEVEDDIGSDTSDRDTVDESDLNHVDKAFDHVVVAGTFDKSSDILTGEGFVTISHSVEKGGDVDLRRVEPLQQRHVDHRTRVSSRQTGLRTTCRRRDSVTRCGLGPRYSRLQQWDRLRELCRRLDRH